ncbi:hypothetical protein ElyMa_005266600 [Elysia marginata]|uniref:Uncharacterized protein n=1 Tax=Elysia marginata TaxID=1093978 RepID=A0AAV4K3I4_9GAST|nr:hypothetical protein ElyMa_005266600 [Elysia marginata]
MARRIKGVWENSMLTTKTKTQVYQACVLSNYCTVARAGFHTPGKERRLNIFHLRCLRRVLGVPRQDNVSNKVILERARAPNVFALLTQRRLHWLGHVTRSHDSRLPKGILYKELASGSRPNGRPTFRYKDVCKQYLKTDGIASVGLKTLPRRPSRQQGRRGS